MVNGYVLQKDLMDVGAVLTLVPTDKQAATTPRTARARCSRATACRSNIGGRMRICMEPIFYRELSTGPNHLCLSRKFAQAEAALRSSISACSISRRAGELDKIRARYQVTSASPVN